MEKIVVTCFYLVQPKPNRSHNLYRVWFLNMLYSLNTEVVVFTDKKSKEFLAVNNPKINYQILEFNELYYYKKNRLEFWENQQYKDPNKDRVWQLSLLYSEKSKFIEKAINLNKDVNWFIWCDIGCFREKKEICFPVVSHLDSDKITLLQIKNFKRKELKSDYIFFAEKQVRIGGGVQAATKKTWQKWISLYDKMFTFYSKNATVNCDQGLLASIIIKNTELVNLVKAKKTKITKDKWFYLLEYCSSAFIKPKKNSKWF